ncbi:MAG: hypothetical protein JXR95_16760 [Deltaproteobacteria bacterium]|nr:hypothetical protein [Deltaproteobacteria bacterium]
MASFNKEKVAENAQKFLKKNQLRKALTEYKKIVENDPTDMRYWKKIGDLQVRSGDKAGAIETYLRVSDDFFKNGFFSKALAILKQIQSMDPTIPEVYTKLADVYASTDLAPDALFQLEKLCRIYENSGDIDKLITTLEKMAEIDPGKIVHRIHLAETYSKLGRKREAALNFRKVADFLFEQNNETDFIRVAERLLYHDPDDIKTIKRLAESYLKTNNAQKVLKKLLQIYQSNPDDIETLHLLARVFLSSGKSDKAIFIYKELAKLHVQLGNKDKSNVVWKRILEIDPDDTDARKVIYGEEEEISVPIEAIEIEDIEDTNEPSFVELEEDEIIEVDDLIEVEDEVEDKEIESTKLLDESEAFLKYGLFDKAEDNLEKISDKESIRFLDISKEIAVRKGKKTQAIDLLKVLANKTFNSDRKKSVGYATEALMIQPDLNWAEDIMNAQTARSKPMSTLEIAAALDMDDALDMLDEIGINPMELDADDILLDSAFKSKDIQIHSDEEVEAAVSEKEKNLKNSQNIYTIGDPDEENDLDEMLEALKNLTTGDLPEYSEDESSVDSVPVNDIVLDTSGFEIEDFSIEMDELAALQEASQSFIRINELSKEEIRLDSLRGKPENQEADSSIDDIPMEVENEASFSDIDPFEDFSLGDLDDSTPAGEISNTETKTPRPEDSQFEPSMDSYEKLMSFSDRVRTELSDFTTEDTGSGNEPAPVADTPDEEPELSAEAQEAINEIDFFLDMDLIDDALLAARELYSRNNHSQIRQKLNDILVMAGEEPEPDTEKNSENPHISEKLEISELEPVIESESSAVSEEEDLAFDFNDEEVTAIQELDFLKEHSDDETIRTDSKNESVRIETETPVGDANTHFDLGLAYKEMGLINQALEEFKLAMEAPGAYVKSSIMIAKCMLEQGEVSKAANELKAVLHSDSINPDEELDIYFELGKIYSDLDDKNEALYYFKKIVRKDPDYRGVNRFISELEQ